MANAAASLPLDTRKLASLLDDIDPRGLGRDAEHLCMALRIALVGKMAN